MRVVGVDPGCTGALALLVNGELRAVADAPVLKVRRGKTDKAEIDGYALAELLRGWEPIDVAVLEQVGGMTGQSPSAAFNFGRAFGCVEGALKTLGVSVETLAPQTWRRIVKHRGGKDDSRAMAGRRWPGYAPSFGRVKDDGRAEAALIGLAWWLENGGTRDGIFG